MLHIDFDSDMRSSPPDVMYEWCDVHALKNSRLISYSVSVPVRRPDAYC